VFGRSATLAGDEKWMPFAAAVDVPIDATTLLAGLMLNGRHGAVSADDVKIDIVDGTIPLRAVAVGRFIRYAIPLRGRYRPPRHS
jgi:hypothetical protein